MDLKLSLKIKTNFKIDFDIVPTIKNNNKEIALNLLNSTIQKISSTVFYPIKITLTKNTHYIHILIN